MLLLLCYICEWKTLSSSLFSEYQQIIWLARWTNDFRKSYQNTKTHSRRHILKVICLITEEVCAQYNLNKQMNKRLKFITKQNNTAVTHCSVNSEPWLQLKLGEWCFVLFPLNMECRWWLPKSAGLQSSSQLIMGSKEKNQIPWFCYSVEQTAGAWTKLPNAWQQASFIKVNRNTGEYFPDARIKCYTQEADSNPWFPPFSKKLHLATAFWAVAGLKLLC